MKNVYDLYKIEEIFCYEIDRYTNNCFSNCSIDLIRNYKLNTEKLKINKNEFDLI